MVCRIRMINKTVRFLSAVFIFFLCVVLTCPANAGNVRKTADRAVVRDALENLCGEILSYDIAFLWFDRLASGRFSLEKTDAPDRYRAVLEAKTLGVAAWLTGNRVQRYVSDLRLSEDGSLRPISHHADMYKTKGEKVKTRLKHWVFDYPGRLITEKVTRNGRERLPVTFTMGDGPYPYDILSAFYNFRAGLYGPLQPGAAYRVPTFAKGVPSVIAISVLSNNNQMDGTDFPAGGFVVKVVLDPEVFDTGNGNLYIWFNDTHRPARVVVKDVVGLGDVRATLRAPEKDPEND